MAENIEYKDSVGAGGKDAAPNHMAEASSADNALHSLKYKYRPGVFTHDEGGRQLGPAAKPSNEYPVKLVSPDPRDERVALKRTLIADSRNGTTPFGQAQLTSEDMDWIESKRKMKTYLALNQFIDNYFDMTNPAIQRMVEQMLPECKILTRVEEAC
jgi:hypothetical protein